jgi:beta-glucanase (GH16 family)
MKSALSLLGLGVATLSQVQAGWVQTWSDEFNGNGVDGGKWGIDQGGGGFGNNELEYYTNRQDNVRVEGGNLIITARRENYGGNQYTSGKLTTSGKFSTIYGKFEMRAKLPRGQGIWPAFWMLGDNIGQRGWPACGEIDIMEYIGREGDVVHGSTHGVGTDHSSSVSRGGLSDGFHTYAANWQPNSIDFLIDDQVYYTVQRSWGGDWPFADHNFFIILNLAVGGNWPGNPDGSTQFPQEFVIDYVRVYEQTFAVEGADTEEVQEKFIE